MALFVYFFTVIFVIVLFTFYYSCIVFVIFMAWFNVLFSFYYSCIVFVSFYKACESIVLGRHRKTGGSGRVNLVCGSRVKMGQSSCGLGWVGLYFLEKFYIFYFFFQLQRQINDNMFRENE